MNYVYGWHGQINDPLIAGDFFPFRSLLQIPPLGLGPSRHFEADLEPFKGPQPRRYFQNYRESRTPSGVDSLYTLSTPPIVEKANRVKLRYQPDLLLPG